VLDLANFAFYFAVAWLVLKGYRRIKMRDVSHHRTSGTSELRISVEPH
jgi:hypothetical protein